MEFDANEAVRAALASGRYDFLDFGCGTGSSIEMSKKIFGAKLGLGIDIDPKHVAATREKGFEAIKHDATKMARFYNSVSFSVMSHFLEHLPGYNIALHCMGGAVTAARDFVFIRQPWFDSDAELARHGFKLYWSDWGGHSYKMTTLDLCRALRDLKSNKIKEWRLFGHRRIVGSRDHAIHPLSSPPGQIGFEKEKHGEKREIQFTTPVYAETVCVIRLSEVVTIDAIIRRFYPDTHQLDHHLYC